MLKKQNRTGRATFLLLFSFCMVIHSYAQLATNSGTEFFLAFGKNDTINSVIGNPTLGYNVEFTLRITNTESNPADVTLYFKNINASEHFTVQPGKIYDYPLTQDEAKACYSTLYASNSNLNQTKSIQVTSTQPVTVIAMSSAQNSIEASLVLPVEKLGKEYYHVGMDRYNTPTDVQTNGYILVATEDNTHIDISYPPASSIPAHSEDLNAGDVYYYGATAYNAYEAKGAHIVANKPIAYFQNGSRSIVSSANGSRYNYTFEENAPVDQWGKEFILPTTVKQIYTEPNIDDPDMKDSGGAYARIFAAAATTNVTVRYTDNSVLTFSLVSGASKDIYIDDSPAGHPSATACYIQADQPVSVCTYHYPYNGYPSYPPGLVSQPGAAWLPPVEQRTRNVLVSPLDMSGKHVYLKTYHSILIIAPTASKDRTMISVDGGPYQSITQLQRLDINGKYKFYWAADNVGGSGYSVGRYYFGTSWVEQNVTLNTTALIDNPDGVIVLAYGQGSYTNYFYAAGYGSRGIARGYYFTVKADNGSEEKFYDMDGKGYCGVNSFTFTAYPNSLTNVVWKIDGNQVNTGNSFTYPASNLAYGYHTVDMIVTDGSGTYTYTTHFYLGGGPAIIWTPEANIYGTEDDKQNWNNVYNWTPSMVPTQCDNVYIPGNSTHYPRLTSQAVCNDIYFIQGGELGRPDLLNYKRAHVHMNFDLKQSAQERYLPNTVNLVNLVLRSNSTTYDRMVYSASVSATPLGRERWYMLSSPLRSIVTGDLSYGGFPFTFLMKFGPIDKDGTHYNVGKWTTPYNSLVEPAASHTADGFAFYMYGWGNTSGNNDGCSESGSYTDLNNMAYLPDNRRSLEYGLKKTNGILELPFFADSTSLFAHRTQVYNQPVPNASTFYYVNDGSLYGSYNALLGDTSTVVRENNDGNYRFAPEVYSGGNWSFQPINLDESNLNDDEFLVGNPYMSSIDMVAFFNASPNNSSLLPQFRIWNGTSFISYSVSGSVVTPTLPNPMSDPRYIAPLQGFLLKTRGVGTSAKLDATFTTTRPAGKTSNLRSGEAEQNILRIKAENDLAASYTLIGYQENASNDFIEGEDITKLFSPFDYVPEVYSIVKDIPTDINFIHNDGEMMIPLGIKTNRTGEIRLTFTGMDNYVKASKIELIDALENRTIDLTGMSSYTYTFNLMDAGIQNGRFAILIDNTTTSTPVVTESDNLQIYGDSKGLYVISSPSDPVQQVIIYDFQGRKVYENNTGAEYYPLSDVSGFSPLIVKATTKSRVKTVKLSMN